MEMTTNHYKGELFCNTRYKIHCKQLCN